MQTWSPQSRTNVSVPMKPGSKLHGLWNKINLPANRLGPLVRLGRLAVAVFVPLRVEAGYFPLRSLVAAGLCRLELGAVFQHGEHDDGESARERNPRLAHR
jgi:hypothetical protein